MRLDFRGPQYRDQKARHGFATALVSKAKELPGIRDAAITTGRGSTMLVIKDGEGVPPPGERERRGAPVSSISPRLWTAARNVAGERPVVQRSRLASSGDHQ